MVVAVAVVCVVAAVVFVNVNVVVVVVVVSFVCRRMLDLAAPKSPKDVPEFQLRRFRSAQVEAGG